MSYEQESEKNVREARERLGGAIKNLGQIVVEECPGTSGMSDDRVAELEKIMGELLNIKRRL